MTGRQGNRAALARDRFGKVAGGETELGSIGQ